MSRLVVAIAHVEFTIANQTLYVVNVQQDTDEWEVRRTYSDFRRLRDDVARVMKRECSGSGSGDACSQQFAAAVHDLPFPAKRLFGSRSDRVVRERAVELHQFLIKLLLLTHTYRKAQKQLYDGQSHTAPQASASVFFLLRDFLKPVASASAGGKSTGSRSDYGGASSSVNGSTNGQSDNDDDLAMRRMIRESKMLSMRTSGHQHQPPATATSALKTKSAPNVLVYNSNDDSDGSYYHHDVATSASAALLRQQSSIPILEEAPRSRKGSGGTKHVDTSSNKSTSKTINSSLLRSRSHRTESTPDRSQRGIDVAASSERPRNVSNASNASSSVYSSASRKLSTASSEPDASSTLSQHQSQPIASVLSSVQQRRTPSAPIAIASASTPSSVPSSSSSVYLHGSAPSSTSSAAVSRAYPSSNYDSSTQSNTQANARMYTAYYDDSDDDNATLVAMSRAISTSAHERRAKATGSSTSSAKKSGAARTKARSASAREARTSERKSRLSPQLTAQAVTIEAQKALEQCVSEYSAIMILRYVDRFISKAVTKTPGCYTVSSSSHRLVIDTERFVEELDETFKDLPADFAMHFRAGGAGDWRFPPALDAYVQMKWKSFQGHASSGIKHSTSARHGSRASRRSSRRVESDGSDSGETEYEYEETIGGGGGYMKPKRVFTDEVADVLDKMIAEGTAGRDQMLRLRRQKNEMGWDRRANPSGSEHSGVSRSSSRAHKTEYWTDTDDDEHRQTGSSGAGGNGRASTAVEHYQQKYNALRKERLSRREGGLV